MKKVVIYGRPQCPWCDRAKELAAREGLNFEYINIRDAGIDGSKLSEICGRPVQTVPQILIDNIYVGGFEDFNKKIIADKAIEEELASESPSAPLGQIPRKN